MERHRCNICFRRFSSGRALGGHMRSHVTPRPNRAPPPPPSLSASSSSFSAADAAADDETVAADAGLGYGLRENPRKSFRVVDPEFSSTFAAAADGGGGGGLGIGGGGASSVVQDRESETESSLPPPLPRRSKRSCRLPEAAVVADAEPLSSISDVSPEEDVARCLMLLSRDAWARLRAGEEADDQHSDGWDETAEDEDYNEDGEDGDEGAARSRRKGRRSRYQCGTCKKFFRSYQALGGHRSSHNKMAAGGCVPAAGGTQIGGEDSSDANVDRNSRLHRCPFCSRVFGSAQALGGHKRSHLASSSSAVAAAATAHSPPLPPPPLSANNSSTNLGGEGFIDLNQPAPLEEELELSALSDATELQSK